MHRRLGPLTGQPRGGSSLALTTDIALAAGSAKFTMAYTKGGLAPDGSSSYFLARMVGLRRAKEMALLNPVLSAKQALEWGLINRVEREVIIKYYVVRKVGASNLA